MQPENVITYLSSLRDFHGGYHNHKETVTYTGAALYVAAAATVGIDHNLLTGLTSSRLLGVIVVLMAVAAFVFVRWQLRLRRWAAAMVWASNALLADALDPQTKANVLDAANWHPTTGPELLWNVYPTIVANKFKEHQPRHGPVTGERVTYTTMGLVTLAVLIRVNML